MKTHQRKIPKQPASCLGALIVVLVMLLAGCERSPQPQFRLNNVELIKQERLNLDDGEHFPEHYPTELSNILTALFGTPNEPRFPFLLGEDDDAHEILSLENLELAAGPVSSGRKGEPSGLYREHCVQCHGITGDGAGPTAAFLTPYPRDFRMGKFKFKSTPLGKPPTDEDLSRIIRHGIPGTAMPSFQTLSPTEVAALIDYVKYLSIRGQYERRLMSELASMDGDPLLDLSLIEKEDDSEAEENHEIFEEQLYTVVGEYCSEEIVARWIDPDSKITEVPAAPQSYSIESADHKKLIETGQALFRGKANCVQCHGDTGLGDGATDNHDAWTKDWLNTTGVDVNLPESYQHFIDAGAMRPKKIRPRNLRMPVFRGGNRPEDTYRRIINGIEGTPMPSSPTLTPEEIWALVAYVRAMPYELSDEGIGQNESYAPVNEQAIR